MVQKAKMKPIQRIAITVLVTLISFSGYGKAKREQEIYSSLTKELVLNEEKNLAFSKKRINEIPKNDTVMIRKAKLVLDLKTRDTAFIVLVKETASYAVKEEELKKDMPSCDSDMYSDFMIRNKKPSIVNSIEELGNKVVYFTEDDNNKIFKHADKGWNYFHKIYGLQPIICYSRPGFNAKGDKALIFYSIVNGATSGTGQFLLFKKVKGVWINSGECALTWIA